MLQIFNGGKTNIVIRTKKKQTWLVIIFGKAKKKTYLRKKREKILHFDQFLCYAISPQKGLPVFKILQVFYKRSKKQSQLKKKIHQHHFYCNWAPSFLIVWLVDLVLSKNELYFIFLFCTSVRQNCFKMNIFILIKLPFFDCCIVFHGCTSWSLFPALCVCDLVIYCMLMLHAAVHAHMASSAPINGPTCN